jgi:ADP-heptose:LPS heptosyltransferase
VDELAPEPCIPDHLRERARRLIRTSNRVIGFVPSSRGGGRPRSLPPAAADAAAALLAELGTVVWIDENPRGRPAPRGVVDLSGKLRLPMAIAVLGECDLCVSVDSGLLHIATVLRKPVVGLFTHIAALRRLWLASGFLALEPNLPCAPCGEGPDAFHCLDSLNVRGAPTPVLPCVGVHRPERIAAAALHLLQDPEKRGRAVWSVGPDGRYSEWRVDALPPPWPDVPLG